MPSFRVKVRRERTFIWGGEKVTQPFDMPLYALLRVDENGEEIRFGVLRLDNNTRTAHDAGALRAGECYAVPLANVIGVYASCASDTYIDCTVVCRSGDQ